MIVHRYTVNFRALAAAVQASGISVSEFCRQAGVYRSTWADLRAGPGMVSEVVAVKLRRGLAYIVNEEQASAILTPLPRGSVKILGECEDLRRRLRQAAKLHRITTLMYLHKVFDAAEDPLGQLEKTAARV